MQGTEVKNFLEDDAWITVQSEFKLPQITSWVKESARDVFLLDVSTDLEVFKGHFPGNPILPGIVQVHWAVGISMAVFSFRDAPFEIKRLKFKSIVQPPRVLELVLSRNAAGEILFKFTSTGQVHSMGCFVIEEETR